MCLHIGWLFLPIPADIQEEFMQLPWNVRSFQGYDIIIMIMETINATSIFTISTLLSVARVDSNSNTESRCAIMFVGEDNSVVLTSNPVRYS